MPEFLLPRHAEDALRMEEDRCTMTLVSVLREESYWI